LKPADFSNAAGLAAVIGRGAEFLRPPPDLKPSEWAESPGGMKIPEGNAVPGPYRLFNAPYQREPMDMLVDPDCYRVTLMWGAQVGKTLLALACQAYCISLQPRSQIMMQPSQGDLATWLETKFNPLVESTPSVRRLVAKPRGRKGVNNGRMKSYPGGFIMFSWSGSPKTMRGRSAPLIVCDEIDGYEVTAEGHPVGLLWQRAATFGDQRFLLEISTPTTKDDSHIEAAFLAGDQRRFYVRCPHCEHAQTLRWGQVRWSGRQSTDIADAEKDLADLDSHQAETSRYLCEAADCGALWSDGERIAAIRNAEALGAGWRAAKPFKGHASYHLNELYSTFRRLRDIVQSYLDKQATDDLQTFVNVSLAQTWEEKGDKADAGALMTRREEYPAQIPMGGLYVTAGIDMQNDRLEVEIVAWGEAEESWSVDYRVLWGDTLQQDVWDELDALLEETFTHESGAVLPISAACLDTGGNAGHTQRAYDYARGKTGRRLFAIKGQGGWAVPVVTAPQRKQSGKKGRKVDLFIVGTDEAKLIVMRRLGRLQRGPGFCHFPETGASGHIYGREHFDQLTAERLVTRYVKGQPIREWHKADRARNEALDCRVYALAALKIMNPSFKRLRMKLIPPGWKPPEPTPVELVDQAPTPATRPKLPAPTPARPQEIPQEAANEPAPETAPTVKKRSSGLGRRKAGGGWVRNW
jgi:phage terminase large subunit GpA-like protein